MKAKFEEAIRKLILGHKFNFEFEKVAEACNEIHQQALKEEIVKRQIIIKQKIELQKQVNELRDKYEKPAIVTDVSRHA